MIRIASLAAAAAIFVLAGPADAQACKYKCESGPVVYYAPQTFEPPIPPHFVVEHGPVYDGIGVHAPPRVYAPRMATRTKPYIYGYGVAFSGGPVALDRYPYVKRARHHRASPPLRVYY